MSLSSNYIILTNIYLFPQTPINIILISRLDPISGMGRNRYYLYKNHPHHFWRHPNPQAAILLDEIPFNLHHFCHKNFTVILDIKNSQPNTLLENIHSACKNWKIVLVLKIRSRYATHSSINLPHIFSYRKKNLHIGIDRSRFFTPFWIIQIKSNFTIPWKV